MLYSLVHTEAAPESHNFKNFGGKLLVVCRSSLDVSEDWTAVSYVAEKKCTHVLDLFCASSLFFGLDALIDHVEPAYPVEWSKTNKLIALKHIMAFLAKKTNVPFVSASTPITSHDLGTLQDADAILEVFKRPLCLLGSSVPRSFVAESNGLAMFSVCLETPGDALPTMGVFWQVNWHAARLLAASLVEPLVGQGLRHVF